MDEAVLDVEIGAEPESGGEQQQPDQNAQRQSDKDYSAWIKSLREDSEAGKYHRRVKDDFGRLEAIRKMDPKGFDGVRSTYEGVNGIAYGEKTGLEAVETMRGALAESQGLLDGVADGNFEALSEDHRNGIIRMTPALLDTLAETNPDAYTAALLPHFVDSLRASGLVQNFNQLVDVLKQQPPEYLTKEQYPIWIKSQMDKVLGHATSASQWFKQQEDRAKEIGGKQGAPMRTEGGEKPVQETGGTANPEVWEKKIAPEANRYSGEILTREMKQWEEKLALKGFRLSNLEKKAIAREFSEKISALAMQNADYTSQMGRYNKSKNPDVASVVSVIRAETQHHAATVVKEIIQENYGDKLKGGKPGPKVGTTRTAPSIPEKGVQYGSVKPRREDIDIVRTPKDWLYDDNRFRRVLKNGKTFELRP